MNSLDPGLSPMTVLVIGLKSKSPNLRLPWAKRFFNNYFSTFELQMNFEILLKRKPEFMNLYGTQPRQDL